MGCLQTPPVLSMRLPSLLVRGMPSQGWLLEAKIPGELFVQSAAQRSSWVRPGTVKFPKVLNCFLPLPQPHVTVLSHAQFHLTD